MRFLLLIALLLTGCSDRWAKQADEYCQARGSKTLFVHGDAFIGGFKCADGYERF